MPVIHIILSILILAAALVIMAGVCAIKHDEARRAPIGAISKNDRMRGSAKTAEQKLKMCIAIAVALFAALALAMAVV